MFQNITKKALEMFCEIRKTLLDLKDTKNSWW